MNWGPSLWWLPAVSVAVMAVAALAAAAAQPRRPVRKYWIAGVLVAGALATGASAWQQATYGRLLADETERLRAFATRLDALARLLPAGPGASAEQTFDTAAAALQTLNAKIAELQGQVEALRQKSRARSIEPAAAAQIAEYLRRSGGHRVVVSCAPDDLEAYGYANQLANVLRDAGWEALGPEKTAIFGEAPGMGVRLYVRNGATLPDAARLLIDAFSRFNIPFESGVTPSDAIPDPATTELFVSHKP